MKKQTTKKRVKKPTQMDRIEANQKLILSKLATVKSYETMVDAIAEAKEAPKEHEPWMPKVGDLVAVVKDEGKYLVAGEMCKINDLSNGIAHLRSLWPSYGSGKWSTSDKNIRPATPQEIAAAEAKEKAKADEEKLAKLKFGVKVRTPDGDGLYWRIAASNRSNAFVIYPDRSSVCSISDITIID